MVIVSPLTGVVPLPNGLFMAYKFLVILTTYVRPGMILQAGVEWIFEALGSHGTGPSGPMVRNVIQMR